MVQGALTLGVGDDKPFVIFGGFELTLLPVAFETFRHEDLVIS
jgi:hypothetical protein